VSGVLALVGVLALDRALENLALRVQRVVVATYAECITGCTWKADA
jgi:hypothetical protein